MQSDEQEIRQLVAVWRAASKAGDVETVLTLMAEDVVFLVPGQPVMRKADFAAAATAQSSQAAPKIEGTSEIQEIKVLAHPSIERTSNGVRLSAAAHVKHQALKDNHGTL